MKPAKLVGFFYDVVSIWTLREINPFISIDCLVFWDTIPVFPRHDGGVFFA